MPYLCATVCFCTSDHNILKLNIEVWSNSNLHVLYTCLYLKSNFLNQNRTSDTGLQKKTLCQYKKVMAAVSDYNQLKQCYVRTPIP